MMTSAVRSGLSVFREALNPIPAQRCGAAQHLFNFWNLFVYVLCYWMIKICAFWTCGGSDVSQAALITHRDSRGASLTRMREDTCVQAARAPARRSLEGPLDTKLPKFIQHFSHCVIWKLEVQLWVWACNELQTSSPKVNSLCPADWMFELHAIQPKVECKLVKLAAGVSVNLKKKLSAYIFISKICLI